MSTVGVHILVEGKNYDTSHIENICNNSVRLNSAGFLIHRADSIKNASGAAVGGKPGLKRLFNEFRASGSLRFPSASPDKEAVLTFFMDRDVDDITGRGPRSPHIVFTYGYDVESDIIHSGSDHKALAALTSLPASAVSPLVAQLGDWPGTLAGAWREWITLCTIGVAVQVKSAGWGFATQSKVNLAYQPADQVKVSTALRDIMNSSSHPTATTVAARALQRVNKRYSSGEGRTLVKGKWLPKYLYTLTKNLVPTGFNQQGFEASVVRCYLLAYDPQSPPAAGSRLALEQLITP